MAPRFCFGQIFHGYNMGTIGSAAEANLIIGGTHLVESALLPMFGKGVECEIQTGGSIREVLCTQLGVENDYLDNRIQTVFLNGRAVDDVDVARVVDGDILALSAAMPGLVGATMRKGGHYAAMREEISYTSDCNSAECTRGRIKIKLFNVLQKEIGLLFLMQGVRVLAEDLKNGLLDAPGDFIEKCRSVTLNGERIDPKEVLEMNWTTEWVVLSVRRA